MLPGLLTGCPTMKSCNAITARRSSTSSYRSTTAVPVARASVTSVPTNAELSLPAAGIIQSESALTAIKSLVTFNASFLLWVLHITP